MKTIKSVKVSSSGGLDVTAEDGSSLTVPLATMDQLLPITEMLSNSKDVKIDVHGTGPNQVFQFLAGAELCIQFARQQPSDPANGRGVVGSSSRWWTNYPKGRIQIGYQRPAGSLGPNAYHINFEPGEAGRWLRTEQFLNRYRDQIIFFEGAKLGKDQENANDDVILYVIDCGRRIQIRRGDLSVIEGARHPLGATNEVEDTASSAAQAST